MADSKTKKYKRPDGSTYMQYGGPKSAQDVEVKEPDATPSPSASPTPSTKSSMRSGSALPENAGGAWAKSKADKAEAAAEDAETVEKVAPWLLEKPVQQEGGLGGAAARAKQKLMTGVSATAAGDAVAADADKKKKKKEEEKE